MNELVVEQRIGALVPKGTPPEIIARLNITINAALADENVRKNFDEQAQETAAGTVQQYTRLVNEDSEKYARLVKELNVTVE